jgi:hypothetical protein
MDSKPLDIFFSYSHKDEIFRDELEVHLSMLKRQGLINPWHDRKITPGEEWKGHIDAHINDANIILLLVTANFLASDYCFDIEMKRALERHEVGEACVLPIILAPVEGWKYSPFSKLHVLPKDGKPITRWDDRDEAFVNVAEGIRKTVEKLSEIKSLRNEKVKQLAVTQNELRNIDSSVTISQESNAPLDEDIQIPTKASLITQFFAGSTSLNSLTSLVNLVCSILVLTFIFFNSGQLTASDQNQIELPEKPSEAFELDLPRKGDETTVPEPFNDPKNSRLSVVTYQKTKDSLFISRLKSGIKPILLLCFVALYVVSCFLVWALEGSEALLIAFLAQFAWIVSPWWVISFPAVILKFLFSLLKIQFLGSIFNALSYIVPATLSGWLIGSASKSKKTLGMGEEYDSSSIPFRTSLAIGAIIIVISVSYFGGSLAAMISGITGFSSCILTFLLSEAETENSE